MYINLRKRRLRLILTLFFAVDFPYRLLVHLSNLYESQLEENLVYMLALLATCLFFGIILFTLLVKKTIGRDTRFVVLLTVFGGLVTYFVLSFLKVMYASEIVRLVVSTLLGVIIAAMVITGIVVHLIPNKLMGTKIFEFLEY